MLAAFIALLSFVFVSRTAEYAIIRNEIDKLGAYYRSIGTLRSNIPDSWDVSAGADLIATSKYIDFEDRRRLAPGIMHGLYNSDIQGSTSDIMDSPFKRGIHVSDVWFVGVVTNNGILFDKGRGEYGSYNVTLVAEEVLAGYPEYIPDGGLMRVFWPLPEEGSGINPLAGLQPGDRVFIKSYYDLWFARGMNFRDRGDYSAVSLFLVMKPIDDNVWYIPLGQDERLNMDAPELADLKAEFDILRSNQSTLYLLSTKDMSAIPNSQQTSNSLFLEDGRWIAFDDHINKRAVCVIHANFAEVRGLTLGDTLTMTIRDFGEYANYYAYGYIPGRDFWEDIPGGHKLAGWQDFPTVETSLEIVGIYNDYNQLNANSFMSAFGLVTYIPDSIMPEGFCDGSELENTQYSFKLKTSRDQDSFINEYKDDLLDMGMSLIYVDNNAAAFWQSATSILQSALFNVIIFSITAVAGLSLAVLLYLLTSRKVYAILRALGASSRQTNLGLILPAMFIALIGILAGGFPAWDYAQNKAVEALSEIEQFGGAATIGKISGIWLVLLSLGLIALVLLIIRFGTLRMARRPILGLLQGAQARRAARGFAGAADKHVFVDPHVTAEQTLSRGSQSFLTRPDQAQTLSNYKRTAAVFHARFVWRYIWRSPLKSLLIVTLTAGMILALGWMEHTIEVSREEAGRLMETIAVEFSIINRNPSIYFVGERGTQRYGAYIAKRTVDSILESGFIIDHSLETGIRFNYLAPDDENFDPTSMDTNERRFDNAFFAAVSNPEVYFADRNMHEAQIEYAQAWTEEYVFETPRDGERAANGSPIILPKSWVVELGVEVGDRIRFGYIEANFVKYFPSGLFVIAGQVDDDVYRMQEALISWSNLESLLEFFEIDMTYSYAHFVIDPVKNRELPEFQEQVDDLLNSYGAGYVPMRAIFWDEDLRTAISSLEQNIRLMTLLFPVTAIGSVILAGGLSALLMHITARETAYLRVLGATKRRVKIVLCSQQIILYILGLILGFYGVAALNGSWAQAVKGSLLVCAVLFLCGAAVASAITAAFVTRRPPMQLLQVRE